MLQYKDNWNKLCNYVKDVIPDIIFSNMKETTNLEEESKQLFLVRSKTINKNKKKFITNIQINKKGKCYKSGSFGHFYRNCQNRKPLTNKSYFKTKYQRKWNKKKRRRY